MIDIDDIDQSVEIDDTLVAFIDLSWFLPISSIYIGKYISSSVHQKMKTEFMQTVSGQRSASMMAAFFVGSANLR